MLIHDKPHGIIFRSRSIFVELPVTGHHQGIRGSGESVGDTRKSYVIGEDDGKGLKIDDKGLGDKLGEGSGLNAVNES